MSLFFPLLLFTASMEFLLEELVSPSIKQGWKTGSLTGILYTLQMESVSEFTPTCLFPPALHLFLSL